MSVIHIGRLPKTYQNPSDMLTIELSSMQSSSHTPVLYRTHLRTHRRSSYCRLLIVALPLWASKHCLHKGVTKRSTAMKTETRTSTSPNSTSRTTTDTLDDVQQGICIGIETPKSD